MPQSPPSSRPPSLTQLKAFLCDCAFDPRNPGPFKAITDTASSDYLELRAIELIQEAREAPDDAIYTERLKKAISLLALATMKP